jgi:hypothetical protein
MPITTMFQALPFKSGGALTRDCDGRSRPPLKPPSLVAALRAPPSSAVSCMTVATWPRISHGFRLRL